MVIFRNKESSEIITEPSEPTSGEEVIPEEVDLHSTFPTETAIIGAKFHLENV